MKKRCSKGKSCGATCISSIKECLLLLGENVEGALGKVRKLIGRRLQKGGKVQKVMEKRSQVTAAMYDKLGQDRGDGKGTHLERPNQETFKIIEKFQRYNERVDALLNKLVGKAPKTVKLQDGTVIKIERKRWYPDEQKMKKLADFTSAARRKYEEEIIEEALSKGSKSQSPKAIMMMGGPASGKSTLLGAKFKDGTEGYVVVDPDAIKSKLPEFQFGVGAGYKDIAGIVHSNSARISREILDRAMKRGFNVLVDGTGSNLENYSDTARKFKGQGYSTQLLAQHVPEKIGTNRAVVRAEMPVSRGGGRFVPIHIIQDAYRNVPRNFLPMSKLVDSASLNDNVSNKMIMEVEKGKVTSEDPKAASRFRRAYGG